MSKKSRLRGPLDRQDAKDVETLTQSQRLQPYSWFTVKIIELEKVSLSEMENLKTVS